MLQSGLSTFTSHTWVRGTFVAVGSVTGQVGVFLRGEQKGCYQLMEHIPVICVAAHQAGFVILSHAMLSFFAPTEPDKRCVLPLAAVRNLPLGTIPKMPCLNMYFVPSGINLPGGPLYSCYSQGSHTRVSVTTSCSAAACCTIQ